MHGYGHDVAGPRGLVTPHQRLRVPLLGLPKRNQVFVAKGRLVAVSLAMVLEHVATALRIVHRQPIPAVPGRHRADAPVHENPQLGVAEPLGRPVYEAIDCQVA